MASIHDQNNVEIEIQEIVIDNRVELDDVVDLTGATDYEEQDMEIDNGGSAGPRAGDGAEIEVIEPLNDENNVPDDTEMQSSMQNATPVAARSVQVLGESAAVNSPDEFQNKISKPSSKNSSKVKSPIKSPEKDDDVSFGS